MKNNEYFKIGMNEPKEKNYSKTCELCLTVCGIEKEDYGCDGCRLFNLASKEELLRRFLISKDDNELVGDIVAALYANYGVTDYDLFTYNMETRICPKCNGSGVIISDGFAICEECDFGLIDNPDLDKMNEMYFIKEYELDENVSIDKEYLNSVLSTVSSTEEYFSEDFKKTTGIKELEIGVMYVDGELDVELFNNNSSFVLLDTTVNPNIIAEVGSFFDIHNKVAIPPYVDIRTATDGRYVLMTKEQYNEEYRCVDYEMLENLRCSHFESMNLIYIQHECSYGEDGFNLLNLYLQKFNSLEAVRENFMKHLPSNDTPVSIIDDNMLSVLYKIISDFAYMGMDIDLDDATAIFTAVTELVPDNTMELFKRYYAPSIYLTEYIMISKEYDYITAIKEN